MRGFGLFPSSLGFLALRFRQFLLCEFGLLPLFFGQFLPLGLGLAQSLRFRFLQAFFFFRPTLGGQGFLPLFFGQSLPFSLGLASFLGFRLLPGEFGLLPLFFRQSLLLGLGLAQSLGLRLLPGCLCLPAGCAFASLPGLPRFLCGLGLCTHLFYLASIGFALSGTDLFLVGRSEFGFIPAPLSKASLLRLRALADRLVLSARSVSHSGNQERDRQDDGKEPRPEERRFSKCSPGQWLPPFSSCHQVGIA